MLKTYTVFTSIYAWKNETLVPVGERVQSKDNRYGNYYEKPGVEIVLCKGKKTLFTLIFRGGDREKLRQEDVKGFEREEGTKINFQ